MAKQKQKQIIQKLHYLKPVDVGVVVDEKLRDYNSKQTAKNWGFS